MDNTGVEKLLVLERKTGGTFRLATRQAWTALRQCEETLNVPLRQERPEGAAEDIPDSRQRDDLLWKNTGGWSAVSHRRKRPGGCVRASFAPNRDERLWREDICKGEAAAGNIPGQSPFLCPRPLRRRWVSRRVMTPLSRFEGRIRPACVRPVCHSRLWGRSQAHGSPRRSAFRFAEWGCRSSPGRCLRWPPADGSPLDHQVAWVS